MRNEFGPSGPTLGMTISMTRVCELSGAAARAAALSTLLLSAATPFSAAAQVTNASARAPAPTAAAPPAPAPAPPPGLSEAVAAVVNDQIISTYDLTQRIRLLIVTSGVQPTEQTFPQ